MIRRTRTGFWLVTIGLLACSPALRAAVMTANIVGSSGVQGGAHVITYVLAQDVTSMTVKIHASTAAGADNGVIRTFTVTAPAALTKGTHTTDVSWDGKTDASANAALGFYYAEIVTKGAAIATMTKLSGPTLFTFPAGDTRTDNIYGGGASWNATKTNHNQAYFGLDSSNFAGTHSGVAIVYPDATSSFKGMGSGFDYVTAAVESDGSILLGGQGTPKLTSLNPDLSLIEDDLTGGVLPRTMQVPASSPTGANADAYFVDGINGGISEQNPVSSGASVNIITNANVIFKGQGTNLASPQRGMCINAAGNALWITASPSGVLGAGIAKYTKDTSGNWNRDNTFSDNVTVPTATNFRGCAISADEKTVWLSCNTASATSPNNQVVGFDPVTGATKGAAYTVSLTGSGTPQGIAVAANGDLYVAVQTTSASGTNSQGVVVLAPPDDGSYTDDTIGGPFQVVADTTIHILTGPTPTVNSFHDATITWTTSVPANSIVKYGTTSANLSQTVTQNDSSTDHSVNLIGLAPNTKYFYQVTSAATGFTSATAPASPDNFTTQSLAISGVTISNVTETNATIAWTTDQSAAAFVDFGTQAGGPYPVRFAQYHTNDTRGTAPTITLHGLHPGTAYYLKAESGDSLTSTASSVFSDEQTFTTLPFVNITSETFTDPALAGTAILKYTTDIASSGVVNWGTDPASLGSPITVPSGTSHTVTFTGLSPATTYYYAITLSATGATDRTTRTSAFVSDAASTPNSTYTESTPDKFALAMRSQVALGTAGSLLSLEHQMVPGKPVLSTNLVPVATRYMGWARCGNYVYSIGGKAADGTTLAYASYAPINPDGSIGAFTADSANLMPAERYVITGQCFSYNGVLYVMGGEQNDGTTLPTVFYAKQNPNGSLQAWQSSANALPDPDGRDLYGGYFYEGNVVFSGGEGNLATELSEPTNFIAQIKADGSLGPFTASTPLAQGKYLHPQAYNAHMLYSIGGIDDSSTGGGDQIESVDAIGLNSNGDFGTTRRDSLDPGHATSVFDQPHYGMGAALLGGKIVTVAGRLDSDGSVPHTLISHTKLGADGFSGPWVTDAADGSANAYPMAERDTDCVAYNGTIYVGNARNNNTFNDTPGWVPMVADPNDTGYAFAGTVDSQFIDLGSVVNPSHLTVAGTNVSASSVEVRYRMANTDGNWSDWFTLSGVDGDISGGARYFQYELVLKASGTNGNAVSPTVNSVTLTIGVAPISSADAVRALQIAGGLVVASGPDKTRLDLDSNNTINLLDAVKIMRKVNGL